MTSPTKTNETLIDVNDDGAETGEILSQTNVSESGDPAVDAQRRDLASHSPKARERLIRFVVGPDGYVVPDLKEELPGRGLWLASDQQSLDLAIKKNLFSRAAKRAVKAPENLGPLIVALLKKRSLEQLGLARREGNLLTGFEKIATALKLSRTQPHNPDRVSWLIEARDGAEDGRNKLVSVALSLTPPVNLCGIFSNDELSLALGLENVIHAALTSGRRSQRFTREIRRLSGFEPLFPQEWRERPFN